MIRRKICLLLCVCLTFSAINVSTVEAKVNQKGTTKVCEFEKADDDTIICYMDGIPIKKSQVDKDGFVDLDARANSMSKGRMKLADTYLVEKAIKGAKTSIKKYKDTGKIPLKTTKQCSLYLTRYQNAIIKTSITAPRYSQNNTKIYLTTKQGAKFASKIETGYAENTIFTALGFVPKIGPTITIAYWVFASYKSSVVSQIRKYIDRGKKVRINVAISPYGTFCGVSEWKGKTCPMVEVKAQNNGGKEKLLSVMLRK